MGFVEAMAIRSREPSCPSDRSQQVPFPRFTYDEAIERFGSDKPDLRFGMELHRPRPELRCRPARRPPGSACSTRRSRPAAASRAIAAPGLRGASRTQIDELTELARRYGARRASSRSPSPAGARSTGRSSSSSGRTRGGARASPRAPAPGDLVLIVADRTAMVTDVLGRLRVELGPRLGLADPDGARLLLGVPLPDVPVGRRAEPLGRDPQPVQRRRYPRTRRCSTTASGRPATTRRRTTRPAARGRMQYDLALNGWELGGGSVRIHQRDLLERALRAPGPHARGDAGEVRRHARGVRVRRAAPRRNRAGHRPLGRAAHRPDQHPRGDGVPQDAVGVRPDAGRAVRARAGPVRGAGPAVRRHRTRSSPAQPVNQLQTRDTSCAAASYGLYTGPNGGLEFYVSSSRGTVYVRSPDAGAGVWDGGWHMVVGTYDGNTVRLFVAVRLTPGRRITAGSNICSQIPMTSSSATIPHVQT